jgi:hypothetical protein
MYKIDGIFSDSHKISTFYLSPNPAQLDSSFDINAVDCLSGEQKELAAAS